ncbi:MAG: DNA-binding protein [Nesterenkonia sp.]|uniref:DNA-binding protein n=1 Tax=Nesterenkonia marinintestina TaxID=2979865 RepID=UPI0021C1B76E|nr:DNA-binding protein [Nesterenkonia sp. GX14115]MDO5492926.1 DNA-binding protein [Nesterenkonia sp.]
MPVQENLDAQRQAYGEPLSEIFGRLRAAFGLNQAGLAGVLGLSAPMLSQLNSGQRVKIGNPAVLQRVQALSELADQLAEGTVQQQDVASRLEEIRTSSGQFTRSTSTALGASGDDAVVAGMRNLLRAVASGAELSRAAARLEADHPDLAEVLRLYGTGPAGPAAAHFARHRSLF